jgi:hypothetical protein
MSTSFSSNNNNSNNNFSIAQADSISNMATATATSVATDNDNDDDEFGDFVDSSSNSGSPLTTSVVHTNSASGSQPAPASLFASSSPISSFTPESNTTSLNITHDAAPVSSDPARATQKYSTTDNILPHNPEQQLPTSNIHDCASHGRLINSTTSAIPLKLADVSHIILSTAPLSPPASLTKEEDQEDSARAENVPSPFESVPSSTELITLFNDTVLHFVDQLFKKLVPLPYALKKRVLANIATKKFLDGYLATIQVGIMVLEGRYRRLYRDGPGKKITGSGMMALAHHDPECERAAREFVRVWTTEIVPRLRTAGLRPVELARVPAGVVTITPTSTTTPSSQPKPPQQTCVVCGLARDEQPSVYLLPRRMRWEEKSGPGHLTCLRFWAHRDIYGITV